MIITVRAAIMPNCSKIGVDGQSYRFYENKGMNGITNVKIRNNRHNIRRDIIDKRTNMAIEIGYKIKRYEKDQATCKATPALRGGETKSK